MIRNAYGKITGSTTRIGNHKVLRWCEVMDIREKGTMDSRRFRLSDDVKAIPPCLIAGLNTLHKSSSDGSLAHDIAALCIPYSRDCQPNFCRI